LEPPREFDGEAKEQIQDQRRCPRSVRTACRPLAYRLHNEAAMPNYYAYLDSSIGYDSHTLSSYHHPPRGGLEAQDEPVRAA
jgi:hypothetical protein